jgi:predicted ribosome quality control (RQC) complex YloA/Tae2 family protein
MHLSFFTIRLIQQELLKLLPGRQWQQAFSQNKDELIIEFGDSEDSDFIIRADLRNEFTCLTFPQNFSRSRRNNVGIFMGLNGLKVMDVRGFEWERAFEIVLENEFRVLFKMHGQQSNILLFKEDELQSLFKNNLKSDFKLRISDLKREFRITDALDATSAKELMRAFPVLDKTSIAHLNSSGYFELAGSEKASHFKAFLECLLHPKNFLVGENEAGVQFSLLAYEGSFNTYSSLFEGLNRFYGAKTGQDGFGEKKKNLLQQIRKKKESTLSYLYKTNQKLDSLLEEKSPEQIAHIIMANMHAMEKGLKSILLHDFYDNREIEIKLKQELSPQKNADYYYRKAGNRKIEIEKLGENIAEKQHLLKQLENLENEILPIEVMKDLKPFLQDWEKTAKHEAIADTKPYREFLVDGFQIWVGKNAKANDELSLKYAHKDDLWLHARGVAGSHVVIKQKGGMKIPDAVLEKAASIAAWFSKAKNDTLCPVIYTQRKYIRKPKRLLPGSFIVEKEKVLIVSPQLP